MNIVLATDKNFIEHCATTIMSILRNNHSVSIYVLTGGLPIEDSLKLEKLVKENNGKFYLITVSNKAFEKFPMPKDRTLAHISLATYYRLFISDLLPNNIDKVIYMDCDIIVRKSLDDLWNIPMGDKALGAVYQIAEWNSDAIKRLQYPIKFGYFNAGVLLINLAFWREHGIVYKLLQYIKENEERIVYHDQDVLNAVLHEYTLRLSCKWNMLTSYFKKTIFTICDINDEGEIICNHDDYKVIVKKEAADPIVVHFVSRPKPWEKYCWHPYKSQYIYYAKLCGYRPNTGLYDSFLYYLSVLYRKFGFSSYF